MRNFVVAAWEQERRRERQLRWVEADAAEHAIVAVAASRPHDRRITVYEAWPEDDPTNNLRITLERRSRQLSVRP
jgi:hypothetical protein